MSLVTRCPACGTTFKVVRDQLRISDGWVRCGRCSEVFDATIELQETAETAPPTHEQTRVDVPAEAPAQALRPEMGAAAPVEAPARHIEEEVADFLDDEHEAGPLAAESPTAEAPVVPVPAPSEAPTASARSEDPLSLARILTEEPWPEASAAMDVKPYVPPYPSLPPFPSIDLSLPGRPPAGRAATAAHAWKPAGPAANSAVAVDADDVTLQKALRRARAKSAKIARAKARGEERAARESAPVVLTAAETEPAFEAPQQLPRFASADRETPGRWQRLTGRRTLVAVAVLAALLLVLQVLRQERDLILARQPSLQPVLAALCGLTGCELAALRQIGDITIDGASFAREKSGDAYRLSFTLRNAAAVPLAMPAVELSLLDTQERAVVRRVLVPAEFGAPPVLPPRAQRAASLPLALSGPEAAALPPVVGFHLLAFYP